VAGSVCRGHSGPSGGSPRPDLWFRTGRIGSSRSALWRAVRPSAEGRNGVQGVVWSRGDGVGRVSEWSVGCGSAGTTLMTDFSRKNALEDAVM